MEEESFITNKKEGAKLFSSPLNPVFCADSESEVRIGWWRSVELPRRFTPPDRWRNGIPENPGTRIGLFCALNPTQLLPPPGVAASASSRAPPKSCAAW